MASSYISSFLRQQGLENEKGLSRQKVFVERAASELIGQVAQMNQIRGTKRRGMRAVSESRGADASADIEVRKYAHEETVEIAEQNQVLDWVNTASAVTGTLMAYYADELEKAAIAEKEAASIAESQAAEEAPMLADHRDPLKKYTPSMLRDPGDPIVDELIRGEFEPSQVDASTGDSQINASSAIYKDGMSATEFKASEAAEENAFLDELVREASPERARELVKAQNIKRDRGGVHFPSHNTKAMTMAEEEMTEEEYMRLMFGGAE